MADMNAVLEQAVERQDVPFAVGMVADAAGTRFSGAAGEAAAGRAAGEDTVFRIFSMTKAIGSVAAMILIDRGRIEFDTTVVDILPEFSRVQVLDGFDGDTPVLRAPRVQATLRHLATHTSGFEYEFWNADVAKYLEVTGHPTILSGLKQSLFYPLTSDPGTRWGYGIGIDWLGQVVEAVDGRSIDVFCREEIFEPLGMANTGFELEGDMAANLGTLMARGEDGVFVPFDLAPPSRPEMYGMGHNLYSTAPDYLRFLRAMLRKGELDGARILSEQAFADMTVDHMQGLTFRKMVTIAPPVTADVDLFPGTRVTHSFAFARNEEAIPGMRSAGSLTWAGVCNTHFWLDPTKGVAAVIMTQSLPFVEERFMATYEAYEKAVYADL